MATYASFHVIDEIGLGPLETKSRVPEQEQGGGGGEGQGEDYWTVYKFTDGTGEVFVQFDGYYMSYDGSTFNEFFFVTPKEVMVTQYFKDKE